MEELVPSIATIKATLFSIATLRTAGVASTLSVEICCSCSTAGDGGGAVADTDFCAYGAASIIIDTWDVHWSNSP